MSRWFSLHGLSGRRPTNIKFKYRECHKEIKVLKEKRTVSYILWKNGCSISKISSNKEKNYDEL